MSTTLWNGANQISGSSESDLATIKSNLTSNETSFKFGVDSEGNYGYYKNGAVVPFTEPSIYSNTTGDPILGIRGSGYNCFIIDISNLSGLRMLQTAQGESSTKIYQYDSWETAISDGAAKNTVAANGTLLQEITAATTKQQWSAIYGSADAKFIKVVEGYNWGATYFTLPETDYDKLIKRVYVCASTAYSELVMRYPNGEPNSLKITYTKAVTSGSTIVVDGARIFPDLAKGYGTTVGAMDEITLSASNTSCLSPQIGKDEVVVGGNYCHVGGSKYGNNGFECLVEVV